MKLTTEQNKAFAAVMENIGFQSIAPNIWRKDMLTACVAETTPTRIMVHHKCGFKLLDEKIFHPNCFNAVLATIERPERMVPPPGMIYLVLAGVSQPAYYMEKSGDQFFMARDNHIHGPAETFGDVGAVYRVAQDISIMGVSLKNRAVQVVASATGKTSIKFHIDTKLVEARVSPETASHVMANKRMYAVDRKNSWRGGESLFTTLAYLAPSAQYDWRVMKGKANPKVRGRAKLALKKGSVIGLRMLKKGDDVKYFVTELKEKMIEYAIPARVHEELQKNSTKRKGKAPDLQGKEKKSYKKDAGTPAEQRNKAASKPAVVSPVAAKRKVPKAAPLPTDTPSQLLKKYQELFEGKEWSLKKIVSTFKADFGRSKPKNKLAALKYLSTKLDAVGFSRIETQVNDAFASKLDGNLKARVAQYDWQDIMHVLKNVLGKDLPQPGPGTFALKAVQAAIDGGHMTEKKLFALIDAQKAKTDRRINALKNPPKKISIGPPPVISGSKPHGARIHGMSVNSDPQLLPDDYVAPGQTQPLKKIMMEKLKKASTDLYDVTENDSDTTAAMKIFIKDLYAKGGSVLSRGGVHSPERDNAWINGKAKSEDFTVRTHPHNVGEDGGGSDIVIQDSTYYFYDWFVNKYAKSGTIQIKEIKHSHRDAHLPGDVADIYFTVKKYPNVLLICRLAVNPDEKKYSTMIDGYHRNMRVSEKNNQVVLASGKRRAQIVNLSIAAVAYNPFGDNFHEQARLLESVVQYG